MSMKQGEHTQAIKELKDEVKAFSTAALSPGPPSAANSKEPILSSWTEVVNALNRAAKRQSLSPCTMKNYLGTINRLKAYGFVPANLGNQHGIDRMLEWVMDNRQKAKNIDIAAIKKASRTCYPSAHLTFPRIVIQPSLVECPNFKEFVRMIKQMVEKKDFELALTSWFLLITGIRIGEAKFCPLEKFGRGLFILQMRQQKSRKPRPLVMITREFKEAADVINWTAIRWTRSWINKQLRVYGVTCHSFRHAFITRREIVKGAGLESTSQIIGHSSRRITASYLIADVEEERKIMKAAFTLNLKIKPSALTARTTEPAAQTRQPPARTGQPPAP